MKTGSYYNSERILQVLRGLYQTHEVPCPHVIFVRRRAEAEEVAAEFGFTWVHGGMKDVDRAAVAERMRSGGVEVVVCTDVWMTGIDIPNISAVVLAMGGSAPIGLKQRSGRGTRLFGAKEEFLIYDVALKIDDAHQEQRVRGYIDGGYAVEGSFAVIEAAERIGEDVHLEALFSPARRRELEQENVIEPEELPQPTPWEMTQGIQRDAMVVMLPAAFIFVLVAVLCSG